MWRGLSLFSDLISNDGNHGLQGPVMRTVTRYCLLLLLTMSIVAVASAQRGRPIVSFKSGPFKMNELDGGGAVPVSGPIVKVLYDRMHRRYLQIDQAPLELRATVTAACADLKLTGLTLATLGENVRVRGSGLSNLAGVLTGSTTITTNEISTAKLATVVPDPVATCNADMDAMVKQDQHGKVQKGWARKYDDALLAELKAHCEGEPKKKGGFVEPPEIATPSASERFPVWVHCGPAQVFRVETSTSKVPVKKSGFQSVRVFVNPPANANYKGPCPKEIAFGGEIEYLMPSDGVPVQVRYRYRTHDGASSPVLSTTITRAGTTNISYWKHEFGSNELPKGVKVQTGPGARLIDGGVRLEVLGPDGKVIGQDEASVKLVCQPQRVPGAEPPLTPSEADAPKPPPLAGVGDALADLVITSAEPAPDSPTTLRIVVANKGQRQSAATNLVVFYHRSGHVVTKSFQVPSLDPRASRRIVADFKSPIAYAERLTARVNDSGRAQESDLSNNSLTIK